MVLAYVLTLVPLNWLICRFVFRRRELAWVVVPLLSLGFAIGVERAAAYDIGYNPACDELDVLEIHGGYPRALSRGLPLCSARAGSVTPSPIPMTPAAGVALRHRPLASWRRFYNRGLAGVPSPAPGRVSGPAAQPGHVPREEMLTLSGAITLESDENGRRIVNGSGSKLEDASIVDFSGRREAVDNHAGRDRAERPWRSSPDSSPLPPKPGRRPSAETVPPPLPIDVRGPARESRRASARRLVAAAVGGQKIEPPLTAIAA